MFKADKWGSTYFFVDMDYTDKGVDAAYWEISRELKFWKAPISAHVEYNGGLNYINNAFLGGAAYNWNSADFSRVFGLQLLYKYIQKNPKPHNFQLTGTWTLHFLKGKCTFSGFADLWYDNTVDGNLILLAEPQFWFNLAPLRRVSDDFKLSIGTEVEISNNFIYNDRGQNNRFYAIPTIACKWEF